MNTSTSTHDATPYDASTYGERIAPIYDDLYGGYDEAMIEVLAELARGGRALELGIGTGRVALPLARRGVAVHGIDASPAMVSRLRAKPGGDAIPMTMGDFADVAVDGDFALIYVVGNTFYGLLSQAEQVRCFRNVARHLTPAGAFVVEAFVPDLSRFAADQSVRVGDVTNDEVTFDVSRHDPLQQRITGQTISLSGNGIRLYPVQLRYCWPSEFDLMAQLAGLRLRERWGDWRRGPFTSQSGKHVSVWGGSGPA